MRKSSKPDGLSRAARNQERVGVVGNRTRYQSGVYELYSPQENRMVAEVHAKVDDRSI